MLNDPLYYHLTIALLVIAGAFIVGHLLRKFLSVLIGKFLKSTHTTLDDRIVEAFRAHVRGFLVLIAMFVSVKRLHGGLTAEETLADEVLTYAGVAVYFLLVVAIFRLTARLITTVLEWYMDEVSTKTNINVTATVVPMASKIIHFVLFLIAVMIVLDHFGVNIGSLVVSLGVGSLAIALAAQETVANMISGFVILVDQPFRVGDRIRLPSGEEGDIKEIGFRSTRIVNYDNNMIVVPNNELVKNRVVNYSFPNPSMRVIVDVGVAYGTNVENARKIILALAEEFHEIAKDPVPEVHLTQLGDSSVQLRFTGRASEFNRRWKTETALREKIYNAFRSAGIEIPFPQRVVHPPSRPNTQAPQSK